MKEPEENPKPTDPEPPLEFPTKALADRQTDPAPDTERLAQPVVAHQDRRHK